MIEKILLWLARLCIRYVDYVQDRDFAKMVMNNPELGEFGLHRVTADSKEFEMVITYPGVYLIADHAAAFLEANNAKNYVQFDLMPRLDRGKRPIRFTVQWANGESPAIKSARLESENAALRQRVENAEREVERLNKILQVSGVAYPVRVNLVFWDWHYRAQPVDRAMYVELSHGDFHAGTTFNATIELDEDNAVDLAEAMQRGYQPVFYATELQQESAQ